MINLDFDTGHDAHAGEYKLSDSTYARLLNDLSKGNPAPNVPPELRANVLHFYSNLNADIATKKDPKAWRKLLAELSNLNHGNAAAPIPEKQPVVVQ